jgi:hypothetical protein
VEDVTLLALKMKEGAMSQGVPGSGLESRERLCPSLQRKQPHPHLDSSL